jgi:osmotically-inducible protein OsmY
VAHRTEILDAVRSALMSEPRIDVQLTPIAADYDDDGTLTLEGEVANVAAKKLALGCAAAIPGVVGIIDRLHVRPAQRMGDGNIRDLVRNALMQEPALGELGIHERVKGEDLTAREPPDRRRGEIRVTVEDGIVTLDGEVPSLAYKCLAGVLAWWVPGSRDVVNGLGVELPDERWDPELNDAVRIVLEKDPFVDASQIRVSTRDSVVRLEGLVPTESEREMAEFDAWYVFGVNGVTNEIEVRPVPPSGQLR